MKNFFSLLVRVLLSAGVAAACAGVVVVLYTNAQLPPVKILEDAQLQVPLRIYTRDGKLIGEYGEKRRSPIQISEVPETLKLAILATEDRRFYEHGGVDLRGLARATFHLILSGTKGQGASTITMQVARNFFLTRKKTFGRKLNEILLAIKIENELPKDKILELYLNKIYFGKRAYGVQAAAQVYYGTTVDKLNLAQMAMIAGLPQAPSAINPINNIEAALKRRTHVLKRMLHYGFINEKQYNEAVDASVITNYHGRTVELDAPHVAEMARKELVDKYGPEVYTSGYVAYTTVDSRLQTIAHHAVQEGLLAYDKRHGYRGPVAELKVGDKGTIDITTWANQLNGYPKSAFILPAAVLGVSESGIEAVLATRQKIKIPFSNMQWAAKQLSAQHLGNPPSSPREVAKVGDVIYVEPGKNDWVFSQLPEAESALISIHPQNGAILSLIGGFDFNLSHFNRATQSTRQPGSNFKPFIYAAALEHGFTAASIINDAPVVYRDDNLEGAWRPQNDTRKFYGPTRLRVGLAKSRNLVTIRLLQAMGIHKTVKVLERFGFQKRNLPRSLSLALGTGIVTPIEIATGYASFANGGYKITPYLIQRVVNSQDKTIFEAHPLTACPECHSLAEADQEINPFGGENNEIDKLIAEDQPARAASAPRVLDAQTAYILSSILQDVILTGTARAAKELNRHDLAGKTGTTNNQMDAWFSGFNQSLLTTVWVGFDEPRSLQEYGSQAALPIWMKFMGSALQGVPENKPTLPRGIITVKIDPYTGLLARPGQSNAIFEIFRQGSVPSQTTHFASNPQSEITPSSSGGGESLF